MNKIILTLTMMLALSANAIAREGGGSEGGGGGGVLARLLVYAQGYLLAELPHASKELSLPETFLADLNAIEFTPVNEKQELTDPHFGYKTWIRILPGKPIRIEYNPSAEYYGTIVESLERSRAADRTQAPRLKDVVGFLLHEMGHRYGYNEEESWKFAFRVLKAIETRPMIKEKACAVLYREAMAPRFKREFSLKATDEVIIRMREGNFIVSHIYSQSTAPQLMLQIFRSDVRTALKADVNAPLDYVTETEKMRFSLRCAEKK